MKRNKLLRIFEIIIFGMIAVLPSGNSLPFHHNHCKTDSDCHQPNFYCYESRECVECTKCAFYNRQINPTIKCAKNKDECGNCTSGMEAELNFDGTFTCNPILTTITSNNSNVNQNPINIESNSNWGLYFLIPLSILASISFVALIIKFKLCLYIKKIIPLNNCSNVHITHNINNNNPAPPPYSEKSPSAPPEEDPLITRSRILEDVNQRANPFHHPNYVNGGTYSDNPFPPSNDDTTPTTPTSPTTPTTPTVGAGITGEDDNTQPSPWSPNPNDLSNEPTSFSNILSTIQPSNDNSSTENNQENRESSARNPQLVIQFNINNTNMNSTVINEI